MGRRTVPRPTTTRPGGGLRWHGVARLALPALVLAVALAGTGAASAPSGAAVRSTARSWVTGSGAGRTARLAPQGSLPHWVGSRRMIGHDNELQSTNWSGLVVTGGTYTTVTGQWKVPAVQSSGTANVSATWIGIDGFSDQALIQTGTAQNNVGGGATQYYAWYELLPSAAIIVGGVSPGNQMAASIQQTSAGMWDITIRDLSSGLSFSRAFAYSAQGSSAEWIEEDSSTATTQPALADFGTVNFTDRTVGGSDLGASTNNYVTLVNELGNTLAYPSAGGPTTLSVAYGTPQPPVITSVSPAIGSTSGGDLVTISGFGLSGVGTVNFGAATAPFTINANGTITTTTPMESPGEVQVDVTDVDGLGSPAEPDFTFLTPPPSGYWLVGSDGGIFSFGQAGFHGSTGAMTLQRPVVGITPTPDDGGYWLDASDGGVFAFGDAGYHGSIPGLGIAPAGTTGGRHLNSPIVAMVPSADGGGYFMVGADGGVFAFGDAQYEGSCPAIGGCDAPAVAVVPDRTGGGYWLVTKLGSVYSFGNAPFLGTLPPQSVPATSAVGDPAGDGYWILLANGSVAAFGAAPTLGGVPSGVGGLDPATAIFATSDGNGYWVASAVGAVYSFGDAANDGSMAGQHLNAPIIAASGW